MVGSTKTQARTAAVTRRKTEPDESTWPGRVGANLRRLREKKHSTQASAVEAINFRLQQEFGGTDHPYQSVSQQQVSAWENGKGFPHHSIIPCVCKAYGCKANELLPPK